jgi:hypothetical protein
MDGVDIFCYRDARTSHFRSNVSVFLFTVAFGMTAPGVESARAHGQNIGKGKLKLIEHAISASRVNYDNAVTKLSSFGSVHFGESIQPVQFPGFCGCWTERELSRFLGRLNCNELDVLASILRSGCESDERLKERRGRTAGTPDGNRRIARVFVYLCCR